MNSNVPVPVVAIAAFAGWNDAGDAASDLISHLKEVWQARLVGEIDPESYYDFQVNRPVVRLAAGGVRELQWPSTRVYEASVRDRAGALVTVVLVDGLEPNMRWSAFCSELFTILEDLDVSVLVTLGSLLADSPHTRPVPVTGYSSRPDAAESMGLRTTDYEGPTGIVGVLQALAVPAGFETVSLWAAVPHYVSSPPCPKATLAYIPYLDDLLEVTIDVGDLPDEAKAWEIGVDELAGDDEEIGDYVRQLEESRDAADLPEASGEAIAREFERYLRHRLDE